MQKGIGYLTFVLLLTLGLFSNASAQVLNWTWYIYSTNVSGGNFDVTFGIRADSGGDIGDLGNSVFRVTTSTDLYDFDAVHDPSVTWDAGSYTASITDYSGTNVFRINLVVSPGSGSTLTTGGISIFTVRFIIDISSGSSNVQFVSVDETYEDDNTTNVSISFDDSGGDVALPILMSNMYTEVSAEKGVTIFWNTESEVNTAGYYVWRKAEEAAEYMIVTTDIIPSIGTGSSGNRYSYSDINVKEGIRYYYKIQELSLSGESSFFGPIEVMGVDVIPQTFNLEANYPNPFNPETTFWYDVPEESQVTIKVYSLLGREVTTLFDGYKPAGRFELKWDGRDELGERVSSGIYILRMQAGTFSKVRKMTLVR